MAEKSDPTVGVVEQDKGTEFLTIGVVGQDEGPAVQGVSTPTIAQRTEDKGGTVSPTIMIELALFYSFNIFIPLG